MLDDGVVLRDLLELALARLQLRAQLRDRPALALLREHVLLLQLLDLALLRLQLLVRLAQARLALLDLVLLQPELELELLDLLEQLGVPRALARRLLEAARLVAQRDAAVLVLLHLVLQVPNLEHLLLQLLHELLVLALELLEVALELAPRLHGRARALLEQLRLHDLHQHLVRQVRRVIRVDL